MPILNIGMPQLSLLLKDFEGLAAIWNTIVRHIGTVRAEPACPELAEGSKHERQFAAQAHCCCYQMLPFDKLRANGR